MTTSASRPRPLRLAARAAVPRDARGLRPRHAALALAVGLGVLVAPERAHASPWTLPRGTMVLDVGYQYQFANDEYFESGSARRFPLRGRLDASSVRFRSRFGITDWLEIEAALPVSVISYASDPVLLLERPAGSMQGELDFYQENVLQLARTRAGPADFEFAGRAQLVASHPFVLATELRMKTPTGYDRPSGTFGARPTSAADFLANVTTYARPDNVSDDVTLGDGQLDLSATVLVGVSLGPRVFLRADGGYVLRFGGAGDQVTGAVRGGVLLTDRLMVYASTALVRSVQQGDVIGISVAAEDPNLPASQYGGATNLRLRELRLERDAWTVDGGLLIRLTPEVELNFNLGRLLWGRNTAAVTNVSASVSIRADLLAIGR